jgi:hypothetical protein
MILFWLGCCVGTAVVLMSLLIIAALTKRKADWIARRHMEINEEHLRMYSDMLDAVQKIAEAMNGKSANKN